MYISLKDSCSNGFNKWANAHSPEFTKDVLADGGDEVAADPGPDNWSAMSSEQRRQPIR
jgi:hypothetical protein